MTPTRLQKRIMNLAAKAYQLQIVWDIITSMTDPTLMTTVMAAWEEKGVKSPPVNSR